MPAVPRMDFASLAARLLGETPSLLQQWFPAGRIQGREFMIGNLAGEPGDSLRVNMDTGLWSDFAGADKGSDLTSLYAAIHRISNGEAYRRLSGNGQADSPNRPPSPRTPPTFIPPPANTPEPSCIDRTLGKPSAKWCYRDQSGAVLFYVARYDTQEGKEIKPWTWDGTRWHPKAPVKPRPLYGLWKLKAKPEAQVVIVEGEKSADAAQQLFGSTPLVLTWPGGSKAVKHADWSAIHGRKVVLWPDADDVGMSAMQQLGAILSGHVKELRVVSPTGQSDGWDAADALAAGWTREQAIGWIKERASDYQSDGGNVSPSAPVPEGPVRWWDLGLESNDGKVYANLDNACRILTKHPTFAGHIWYDEFRERIMTTIGGARHEWSDADDLVLQRFIQRDVGIHRMPIEPIQGAVELVARQHSRNEPREWMSALKWDGTSRLNELMPTGFGAESNEYTQRIGECFMIGMVARVFKPGEKVDTMPVFEGTQGAFKSQALSVIGGDWFIECHEAMTTKDFYIVIAGNMLIEISELHAFTRAEIERVKGIITTPKDRYRTPHEKRAADHPRQGVFAGTTNRDDWNRDDTGARRFWPIRCGTIRLDWLREHRDQIFAEAVERYKAGEDWWVIPTEMAQAEQEQRRPTDPWKEAIASYINDQWQLGTSILTISNILINAVRVPMDRQDRALATRVGCIVAKDVRWRRRRTLDGYHYERTDDSPYDFTHADLEKLR